MTISRRKFLQTSLATTALSGTLSALMQRAVLGSGAHLLTQGYGPLLPAMDEATGLDLVRLPEGFRYISFGWSGDEMSDGILTPPLHDGMGVIQEQDGIATIIRNHEIEDAGSSFGADAISYDPQGQAGCTLLRFDLNQGRWLSSQVGIAGTVRNCAGGVTPWGSWLTCEETVATYERPHGYVFEVPAEGPANPTPITGMGRFWHEAVAVDPETGIVFQTEDRPECGFYRYIPNTRNKLHDGGKLQMLKARGHTNLRAGIPVGQQIAVSWVDIADPQQYQAAAPYETQGVFLQGRALGGATFARLEGCHYSAGKVYITATIGGSAGRGQVWEYSPGTETLTLLFESPGMHVLDMPDNMTVSPRGGLVLCENGDAVPQRIQGLTKFGQVFPFAASNFDLRSPAVQARLNEFGRQYAAEDYRKAEWAGATFSNDGRWLFVNNQVPGVTLAITGPWAEGLI